MVRPEVVVALRLNGATPYTRSVSELKVIVCDALVTVNVALVELTVDTAPEVLEFFTTTEYVPASDASREEMVYVLLVALAMSTPSLRHW